MICMGHRFKNFLLFCKDSLLTIVLYVKQDKFHDQEVIKHMKRWMVLGAAGILSLAMGTSVFAADLSDRQLGRMQAHHIIAPSYVDMTRNYMRPASSIGIAKNLSIGNCNLIDGEWVGHCDNYVDTGYNGCGNYVDADQDNVCDNWQGTGYGNGYCDGSGNGYGSGSGYGNGYCGGNGYGNGYGGGHHSNGNGRGCQRW